MYIYVHYKENIMQLLTIQEVAQTMRVNPITVRRHIKAGNLEAVRVGRRIRVKKESVNKFIKPIVPKTQHLRQILRGKPTSADDPLWKIVGMASSAKPTDASKKHEYLADAYTHYKR